MTTANYKRLSLVLVILYILNVLGVEGEKYWWQISTNCMSYSFQKIMIPFSASFCYSYFSCANVSFFQCSKEFWNLSRSLTFFGNAFRFAAALKDLKVWVMNVVPVDSRDTLPIIFERGLTGIYHDWCESFSTYPRTYDLLHADHLFSVLKKRYVMKHFPMIIYKTHLLLF